MLRYRTAYGPITSPMGLLSLSTMSQTHNAYYYPAKLSSTDYLGGIQIGNTVTRESTERLRRDAEKEEE